MALVESKKSAATELTGGRSQGVLLLQSTAMSANVVFINIDWKASRHQGTLAANMKILGKTITNVVHKMNPTMMCMCEVGEATIPLTEKHMQEVESQCMHAWKEAATAHFELRSMFQVGAPYMTIYKDGPIQCSDHRILEGLYYAKTFLCCGQVVALSGIGHVESGCYALHPGVPEDGVFNGLVPETH